VPSEEGKEVLRLLAEKKIDAEQAYRLLAALGDVRAEARRDKPPTSARRGGEARLLRIRITEGGKQKVNIAVPLALARLGRVGGIAERLRRQYDLDLSELLQTVQNSPGGKIVDVVEEEDGSRVEIFVE
jgi:hypothetical protein